MYGNTSTMAKIKKDHEDRQKHKRKILDIIYKKASLKIIDSSKYRLNHCNFRVPDQLPGYDFTDINIADLTKWLIGILEEEGFTVFSLNGIRMDTELQTYNRIGTINDILITWKLPEVKIYESKIKFDKEQDFNFD